MPRAVHAAVGLAVLAAALPAASAFEAQGPTDCQDPLGILSECPNAQNMCAGSPFFVPAGACWTIAPAGAELCAYYAGCTGRAWTGYAVSPGGEVTAVQGACVVVCTVANLRAGAAGASLVVASACPIVACTPAGTTAAGASGASTSQTPMCVFLVPGASLGCWRVTAAAGAGGASVQQAGPCPNVQTAAAAVTGCYANADATAGAGGARATIEPACGTVVVGATWRNVCVEHSI